MSPKATAVLVLMLTVVFAVGPHLPELVAGSGMIVDYTGNASPLSTVEGFLRLGYGTGKRR